MDDEVVGREILRLVTPDSTLEGLVLALEEFVGAVPVTVIVLII